MKAAYLRNNMTVEATGLALGYVLSDGDKLTCLSLWTGQDLKERDNEMNSKSLKLVSVFIGVFISCALVSAATVQVDPPDRLMNPVVLGEWNTAGNLEGWTGTNVSGLTATGGNLQGTGTAATPTVQKTAISGGPNLNYGFYDYLQIRTRVPNGFADDVVFSFGTSVNPGFATSREFKIPNASLVKDNSMHAYRLDLGLEMYWRDTLSDIQVKPLGSSGNGVTFYIDYVEVGDLPGDTLSVNTDIEFAPRENLAKTSRMESKHTVFWWSNTSRTVHPQFDSATMGPRSLRMMEESWQVYVKYLTFDEPCYDMDGSTPGRFKTNMLTWFEGYWMGGRNGFSYFNVDGSGLYDEGWGNPVPHEFGHCVQGHQTGMLEGGHWESHAEVMQNFRDMYFYEHMGGHPTNIGSSPYEWSNYRIDHGRLLYADYRPYLGTWYYPGPGQDWNLATQLWSEGDANMTVFNKMAALLKSGQTVQDVFPVGLQHFAFIDFVDGWKLKTSLWADANTKAWWWYITGGLLTPLQDKAGWYGVSLDRSPERFAYIYHELAPTSSNVTVELRMMDVVGSTEGLRFSLAAMDTSENMRYVGPFAPGTQSITMGGSETKLFVVVMAIPTDTGINVDYLDNRFPVDKCPDRLHYGYEIRLVNAVPATTGRQLNRTESGGHSHPNGGGYVGPSATVDSTAYVGPNARVLGTAKVYNTARVEDYAIVMGNATVQNTAVVSGYSVVTDSAIVRGNGKVRDRGILNGSVIVEGNGLVKDYAHLYDTTNVKEYGIAGGCSVPFGATVAAGTSILGYDYSMADSLTTGVHFGHIPWGDWVAAYYTVTRVKPRGLTASYRTEEAEGEVWWDEFGAQHAVLRGAPSRVSDTSFNSNVLRLNGTDQYAVVDRALVDTIEASYGVWVKPTDNTTRPILFMGSSATKYLKLELDASGKAKFTITNGTTTNTLTSTTTIPTGSWTYLTVTLSGAQGILYVGGTSEATGSVTLSPDDVLGANDHTVAEGMFVGRDWAGATFAGDVEDVRFYNVVLTSTEIANEKRRCGDIIGAKYWDASMTFNGTSTTDESGIRNGVVRTLEANVYPHTSDDVAYYEGILDSSDELNAGFEGSGFGLDNGKVIVRLDNVGFWDPNATVTLNQWQRIKLVFDGSTAALYVNDVPKGTKSYSATANDMAGKLYRIGYASDTTPTKYYFDGEIKELKITDNLAAGAIPATSTPLPTNTPLPYQVSDDFSATRNYVTQGVSGTFWSGMVGLGTGETVDALNANSSRAGQLYIQSTGATWAEAWSPLGPFLYRDVTGDFVATVKVTDYAGTEAVPVYHNNCGLMARALKSPDQGGNGEDWVSIDYFPIWSCGNYVRVADNNSRTEVCHNGLQWSLNRYLRLERMGDVFRFYTSSNGVNYTEMSCSPITRSDLNGLTLQVGMFHATYDVTTGYAAFDDFVLNYASAGGPTSTPTITPTATPAAPGKATNPTPAHNAQGIPKAGTTLSWTAGAGATSHDVYFGTTNPPPFKQNQTGTTYATGAMSARTYYYWRIDEKNQYGTTTGDVWRFKTGN